MKGRPHPRGNEDDLLPPSDAELEQQLRRLPLAEPGRRLDTQIARLLSTNANAVPPTPVQANPQPRAKWAVMFAAAAAILLVFGVSWFLADRRQPAMVVLPPPPVAPILPAALVPQSEDPVELDLTARLALAAEEERQLNLLTEAQMVRHPASPRPVGLQQTIERIDDEGFVLVQDGAAYRRLQRHAVRQILVVDPRTGQSATVSIPERQTMVKRVEPF